MRDFTPRGYTRPGFPALVTNFLRLKGGFDAVRAIRASDRADLRGSGDSLRRLVDPLDPGQTCRQRAHAGDRRGDPGRRARVSQPPVHDDRDRRRRAARRDRLCAGLGHGDRLCDRRDPVRPDRLHRHEHLGARERAHGRSGAQRYCVCARGRIPRWRDHRHAGRGPRAARRRGLLHRADASRRLHAGRRAARAGRACVRLVADLDLRAPRRRHLHQGRRRRRRSRRQGRSRHSGGRSAQPGGDRGQRRRQRRRLRRHGGGPLRNLRGDADRDDAARRRHVGRRGPARRALSARARRRLDRRVDHRHVLREGERRRQDHERAVQGRDRVGRARAAGVHPGDAAADGRQRRTACGTSSAAR